MSSEVTSPIPTADRPAGPRFHPAVRLLLMLLMFLAAYALALLVSVPFRLLGDSEIGGTAQNVVGCLLVLAFVVIGTGLLMRFVDRRPLRETGWLWTRSSLGLLGIGLGISVVIGVGFALVGRGLGVLEAVEIPWAELTTTAIVLAIIAKLAQAFALQGIPEELVFRGYLMQTLREHPKVALLVSTLFFGVIHLVSAGGQQNLTERFLYLIWPTGFGFCAAALVLRLRSLWPAVGIHAGSHVANLIIQFTGIAVEGPIGWVTVGLLYFLAGGLALIGHQWRPVSLER